MAFVPHPRFPKERLTLALADALRKSLRSETIGAAVVVAAAVTAAAAVPRAGPWLALGLLAVAAWWYEGLIEAGGAATRSAYEPLDTVRPFTSAVDLDAPVELREPTPESQGVPTARRAATGPIVVRVLLAVVAALALVAPVFVRLGGYFPPMRDVPGLAGWTLVAVLVGWFVTPLVLLAAFARDHHGRLSPGQAIGGVLRRPLATLTVLMILPVGALATEAVASAIAWHHGYLPILVAHLFPTPRFTSEANGVHAYVTYQGYHLDAHVSDSPAHLNQAYRQALRRGYTLVGGVPASLSRGTATPFYLGQFDTHPRTYLEFRAFLSVLMLWAVGVVLAVQARCLGALGAVASRRPRPSSTAPPSMPPADPAAEPQLELEAVATAN